MKTSKRRDSQWGEVERLRAREMLFNFFSSMHLSRVTQPSRNGYCSKRDSARKDAKRKKEGEGERERGKRAKV